MDGDGFNKWSYDRPQHGGDGGEKRSAQVLKETESEGEDEEEEEEEAGGFLLPATELDDDSERNTGSVNDFSGNDSSIAASRRSRDRVRGFSSSGGVQDLTDGCSAGQSKGKGKEKCKSGDDLGHAYDDEGHNIDEESAGVINTDDVILARSLQEEEDRRAAVALQRQDSDEEGEGSDRRGVRKRNASAGTPPAAAAAAVAAANSGGTRNGWKRQQGDTSFPESSERSRRAADEKPTPELEPELKAKAEAEEIEIELEMDTNNMGSSARGEGGDGRPSDFWELVRRAEDDGGDDDEEYDGFVDDDGGDCGSDGGGVRGTIVVGQPSQVILVIDPFLGGITRWFCCTASWFWISCVFLYSVVGV